MPNYRRRLRPGGTYFFTLVTYQQEPFLCRPLARGLLRDAILACQADRPFILDAVVLLPDHLHAICTMPPGDFDFSTRWGVIKKSFTQSWLAAGGREGSVSESRAANRRRGVWQRRFWEHGVRDVDELQGCADYVHYNPVKHGLARCPHEWPWSSFSRWVRDGVYPPDWKCVCDGRATEPPTFGQFDLDAME